MTSTSGNFLSPSKRRRPGGGSGGIVTHRHLLSSSSLTPTNPLRVIAHCDIDAAYAQFEMVRLNLPEDQPVCVQQWSGLIAVNYPARKFGITRHMDVLEAKKKCPHLTTVHVATYREGDKEPGYHPVEEAKPATHKVSLDPYRRESAKILAIFKEMVPSGDIEKASIDEAFLDLTSLTIAEILKRYPHLSKAPTEEMGLDTPLPKPGPIEWSKAGNVFPIRGETNVEDKGKPQLEDGRVDGDGYDAEEDLDDVEDDVSSDGNDISNGGTTANDGRGRGALRSRSGEPVGGWEDMALCIGAEIMASIRLAVHTRLGYTCSAGVAHNKTLSKLCSGWKKPNAQTILRGAAVPAFLNPLPFNKIRNLGGKLGTEMAQVYEASTVGDMLAVGLEDMQKRFGEESIWVYNILRGIDYNTVTDRTATKSMLASKNITPMVTTREQGYHWLTVLAGELYVRLRDAREISEGLWPKTLSLGTRQPSEASRSRQRDFPFSRNLSTEYIAKYAFKLWDEVTEPMTRPGSSKSAKLRFTNLALSFSGLERLEGGQKGIEGFFAAGGASSTSIGIGNGNSLKRERSASAGPSNRPGSSTKKFKKEMDESAITLSDEEEEEDTKENLQQPANAEDAGYVTWTCPRCKKVLKVSTAAADDEDDDIVETTQEGATGEALLTIIKQEHEDMHFAQDLHREDRATNAGPAVKTTSTTKKKKKVKKPKGIAAFFTPLGNGG